MYLGIKKRKKDLPKKANIGDAYFIFEVGRCFQHTDKGWILSDYYSYSAQELYEAKKAVRNIVEGTHLTKIACDIFNAMKRRPEFARKVLIAARAEMESIDNDIDKL